MAINIEAIRAKLNSIAGNDKKDTNKYPRWKYEKPGTYTIRVIPWKDQDPSNPFPEFSVYYNISKDKKGMMVSPEHNGHEDPIKQFRISLYNEAKQQSPDVAKATKEQASMLKNKTLMCVAVVDRANEEAGPQLWTPNFTDSQSLLSLFLTDVEDYTDLEKGCDLQIIVSPTKKINQTTKKPILEAKIQAARQNSPAHKDPKKVEEWMNNLPVLSNYYSPVSTETAAKNLKEWLEASSQDSESDGTSRGGNPKQEVVQDTKLDTAPKKVLSKEPAKKASVALSNIEDDLDAQLDDLDDTF